MRCRSDGSPRRPTWRRWASTTTSTASTASSRPCGSRPSTDCGPTMESLQRVDDPGEALIEGFRRYRALARAHPMAYRLMFLDAVPGFAPSPEAAWTAALSFDALVAAVRRAMDSGAVAAGDAVQMAQVIWAAVHGWVSLELDGMIFLADADAGAETMARSLVAGFRIPRADRGY